jgi:hypothetical protein
MQRVLVLLARQRQRTEERVQQAEEGLNERTLSAFLCLFLASRQPDEDPLHEHLVYQHLDALLGTVVAAMQDSKQ